MAFLHVAKVTFHSCKKAVSDTEGWGNVAVRNRCHSLWNDSDACSWLTFTDKSVVRRAVLVSFSVRGQFYLQF